MDETNKKKRILESLVKKAKKKKNEKGESSSVIENAQEESTEEAKADESQESTSFTVVGKVSTKRVTGVKHYLPEWLRHPKIISLDLKTNQYPIEDMKFLEQFLIVNLLAEGITHFFPVQYEVLPWLLNDVARFGLKSSSLFRPRDICVSAPTGSGKTLAYGIPIVQCLCKRVVPKIRALIIAPVQELVLQITAVLKTLVSGTKLNIEAAVGGKTPLLVEQKKLVAKVNDEYESQIDILVTTPGRLVEHLQNTEGFDLRSLRYLVMDEADRMFENVQNEWLYHLEKHLHFSDANKNGHTGRMHFPQRLLFSATLSQDPEKLKKLNLFQPVLFSTVCSLQKSVNSDVTEDYIGTFTTPAELKEKFIVVDSVMKPLVICELIQRGWKRILCFTKSAVEAHKLSLLLSLMNPKLQVKEISSLLPTAQRNEMLQNFSSGSIDLLIASDVCARGIDINDVKYVISYDPPKHIQSYIHRVGRTGRAGIKGIALTILTPSQEPAFNQMISDVSKNNVKQMALDEDCLQLWKDPYGTALQELKQILEKEQHKEEKNEKIVKTTFKTKNKKTKAKKVNSTQKMGTNESQVKSFNKNQKKKHKKRKCKTLKNSP